MRRTLLATGLLALLGLVGLAGSAGAQTTQPGSQGGGAATAAEHRRIVEYWTPARQAAAVERGVQGPRPNAKPGGAPGGGGGGGGGSTSPVTGATWTGGGAVVATSGKVFFTMGGVDYTCSGNAVDSAIGSVVLTAGHCTHDLTAGWATNFEFLPAYNGRANPTYGTWTATALFTTSTWYGSEDFRDDAGFAVVTNGTSATLESVLATSIPSIHFSSDVALTSTHYAFGYPASKKYKGSVLSYCRGPIQYDAYDNADTFSMTCDMTSGSSGGAWYETWDDTAKTGAIVSLNSYYYLSLQKVMFGPVFDDGESAAFNAAGTAGTCSVSTPVPCTPAT